MKLDNDICILRVLMACTSYDRIQSGSLNSGEYQNLKHRLDNINLRNHWLIIIVAGASQICHEKNKPFEEPRCPVPRSYA